MHARSMIAVAVVGGVCFGLGSVAPAHEGLPSEYNFRDDVRPIFVEHCSGCHRPGGVGPMSLLSYSDAVPWANAVKMQVLDNQMPPWLPAEGVGDFRHTRSLSAAEVDILLDWIIGQTPEGEPLSADETAIEAPPEWAMGTPDLILTPSADVVLGEDVYELTECVVLPVGTNEDHVASAFELNPGLATIVRRATIYLGEACESTRPVATWLPGQWRETDASEAPLGYELPRGSSLAVEILYVKGWEDEGKRLTDRSQLGVRFAESGRTVSSVRMADGTHTFEDGAEIVALFPAPGDGPLTLELVRPGATAEPILVIDEFRPEWREKYFLAEPLELPPGSELRLSQSAVWIDFISPSGAAAE